jgi:hypothetical protein
VVLRTIQTLFALDPTMLASLGHPEMMSAAKQSTLAEAILLQHYETRTPFYLSPVMLASSEVLVWLYHTVRTRSEETWLA